jgi:glycosyltransferase involved in cell wall biosynthesis
MDVAINALAFTRGGGVTYMQNLIPRLAETNDDYYIFITSNSEITNQKYKKYDNISLIIVTYLSTYVPIRLFFGQIIIPMFLIINNTDVLFTPTGITSIFSPCKSVNMVRDPNPYNYQSNRRLKSRIRLKLKRFLTKLSILKSTDTIYVSNYTKNIASKYLPVEESKAHIVYHGIDKSKFTNVCVSERSDLEMTDQISNCVLTISTIYKHKNYEVLINAYSELSSDFRDEHPLVIVGGYTNQQYYDSILKLIDSNGISDDVILLGKIRYQHVPYVYSKATVSVLPSKLETFGHPLVESMAAGVPVIAANASCIPEIVGDAAVLFDPDQPAELATQLRAILTDDKKRTSLIKKGEMRVQKFSWDKTIEQTHRVIT